MGEISTETSKWNALAKEPIDMGYTHKQTHNIYMCIHRNHITHILYRKMNTYIYIINITMYIYIWYVYVYQKLYVYIYTRINSHMYLFLDLPQYIHPTSHACNSCCARFFFLRSERASDQICHGRDIKPWISLSFNEIQLIQPTIMRIFYM